MILQLLRTFHHSIQTYPPTKARQQSSITVKSTPLYSQPASTKLLSSKCKEFCQDNLYFRYNNTVYRQTSGTGMGRIYAPSIADLKQGYNEVKLEQKMKEIFAPQISSFFLQHYRRYLDDIHFRWKNIWVQHLQAIKKLDEFH